MLYDDGVTEDVFDPKIHLAYTPPSKKFTLQDLKIESSATSSEIAATVPFPILSYEGVRAYRRSLFRTDIIRRCSTSPYPGTLIMRNAIEYSQFIKDFWTHPATMHLVSDAAGVPLSIIMSTEIGHTNIQTSGIDIDEMIGALRVEPDATRLPLSEEDLAYDPLKSHSIIPWHYDSYPYVCVLMLSETNGMIGGETYIKGGDGVAAKVEGPALGFGVLLQGGEVQHLASRGLGVRERITTITSYCANIPGLYDSSYISNIRPYCDLNVLYKQWTSYRLGKMRSEIENLQRQVAQSETIDVSIIDKFVGNQIPYLKRTARQLIPYEECKMLYGRYGKDQILKASQIWKRAEELGDFESSVASINQSNWMPQSQLWYDLAQSQVDVRAGKILQSQKGRHLWTKKREFLMGDELLAQGLPELFLSWLDATGLYGLLKA